MLAKNEIGIYVHIPFCKKKCDYCDFISYCNKDNLIEKYVEAMKKEIESQNIKPEITTIYIGGGTPSYIDSKYIIQIINKIKEKNVSPNAEITIEVNPGTVTMEKLEDYRSCGINRISIGLQSTNNTLLKEIGRIHDFKQFLETYKMAKKVGFKNINVDLMLGLPNQRIKDLKESLEQILKLKPKHVSVYSLIVEDGTPIANKIEKGELQLPDEELERNMYWFVKNTLELNGYKHYEISNFAKKGYESKHNLNCWNQKEYIGIGVAAHSYRDITRYSNTENIEEYIKNVNNEEFNNDRFIGYSMFNYTYGDNTYIGYMTGIDNQCTEEYCAGTTNTTSYEQATSNTYNSVIKTFIDSWYETNIEETGYSEYLADVIYCNDRSISSGDGYGENATTYMPSVRKITNNTPVLTCSQKNDAFTVNDTTYGNGMLTYPIGLITSDEAVMAGVTVSSRTETDDRSNYLNSGNMYWTMSPSEFMIDTTYGHNSAIEHVLYTDSLGGTSMHNNNVAVKPVISLKSSVNLLGQGTMDNPYVAQ